MQTISYLFQALEQGDEFCPITFAEFNAAPSPRLIKSHAPSKLLLGMTSDESMPKGLKMIVMSRNPFDSCVSRYYHAFNPHASGWSFSAWAAVWLSGNTAYGSWFEWVRDWNTRAQKHREQILWIQYEEMIQDPQTQIRNIIDFLGVSDECDIPALIERVADGCSFDSMKRHANEGTSTDFEGHLRKGVKGDWVNHFTEDIECAFIRKYHEELGGSGLAYDFGANLGIVQAGAPNDASKLSKSMLS
jgi:Sulfotransferase domain